MTMQRTLRLFKLPDMPEISGFRKLVIDDVPKAHKLLQEVRLYCDFVLRSKLQSCS